MIVCGAPSTNRQLSVSDKIRVRAVCPYPRFLAYCRFSGGGGIGSVFGHRFLIVLHYNTFIISCQD
jgi:hypothetical protein